MADLMIEVDDGTLKDARMRTFEEDTSVNALAGVPQGVRYQGAGAGGDGAQDRRNIQGLRELIISREASR